MIRCDIYIVSRKEKKVISHDYNYRFEKTPKRQFNNKKQNNRRGYYGYCN